MKPLILILCLFFGTSSMAATQSSSFQKSFNRTDSVKDVSAVISTNMADLSKSRPNVQLGVMMSPRLAAAISYSSMSERMVRDNTASRSRFTVDRTQFGIGTDFYLKPLNSVFNIAFSPSFIFQNESDAFTTDSTNGLGLRAMGIYKPLPRLMAQGGLASTVIGSKTNVDALMGVGLLF